MTEWHFWGEKQIEDVYGNIYIRAMMEDWFQIVFSIVEEINKIKGKKAILDIGCGEGHTTKQILDRIKSEYICDLIEPNKGALNIARAFLKPENCLGEAFDDTLANFNTKKKYDVVFTSHTNYYWAVNENDYRNQLRKLINLKKDNGVILILTLPEESDHYNISVRQIYPEFNYSKYIADSYRKMGLKVKVKKLKMRMYVGDILSTDKTFDLKTLYKFIHNTDSYPSDSESRIFLNKIKRFQKNNYLDFKDELIIVG